MKQFLIFISGLLVGGAGAYIASKTYYEKKMKEVEETADRQIKEMEEYYKRTDEFSKTKVNPIEEQEEKKTESTDNDQNEIKEEARRKLQANWERTTQYANRFKKKNVDPAELEHPEEDEEDEDEDEDDDRVQETWYDEDHAKNMNRPPRIVKEEDLASVPEYYGEAVIYYFEMDDMFCDENLEPMNHIEYLVGDTLNSIDWYNSDGPDTLYIQNFENDYIYDIVRRPGFGSKFITDEGGSNER